MYETKNRFSAVCAEVAETGRPLVVTRRGRPLVRIVPVEPEDGRPRSVWDTVDEARAKYGPLTEDFELPERPIDPPRDPFEGWAE